MQYLILAERSANIGLVIISEQINLGNNIEVDLVTILKFKFIRHCYPFSVPITGLFNHMAEVIDILILQIRHPYPWSVPITALFNFSLSNHMAEVYPMKNMSSQLTQWSSR